MSARRSLTFTKADGQPMTVDLWAYLDAEAAEQAANESNQWIKSLRTADIGGASFRDRFTYRGDSLWWFAEIFLHRQAVITDLWRTALALDALCARERPTQLSHLGGDRVLDLLAPQAAARHGARHQSLPAGTGSSRAARTGLKSRIYTWSALASRLRPRTGAARTADAGAGGGTLVFVHSAFVHGSGEEGYIGAILRELQQRPEAQPVRLVGVGPRTNFKARRWWHPLVPGRGRGRGRGAARGAAAMDEALIVPVEALAGWDDLAGSRGIWRERRAIERALLASDALRQRARLRGYDIWPVVRDELRGVARLQFTWSARAMDEAGAAMERYRPARVVTYAEAGGWGRAIMLEARRRGIPSVGLQHGFIYRHWLNYLHTPDEMAPSIVNASDRGFPRPDRTLLYDGYAARHLRVEGHFPPGSLAVTGSPGLDALVAAVRRQTTEERARIRGMLGLAEGDALGVIVSKHTQIRDALPALARAAAARPGLRLIVKPHPAEVAELYAKTLAAAPDASRQAAPGLALAPAGVDLAGLLAVAQFVITVNSTVAIDAMSLGLPSLIVLLPNNLSPFVSAGAMAGAPDLARLPEALEQVLTERPREALLARARQFLRDSGASATSLDGSAEAGTGEESPPAGGTREDAIRGDGRAAARAADEVVGASVGGVGRGRDDGQRGEAPVAKGRLPV